jgi:ferritin-like metal-binding protein YciE
MRDAVQEILVEELRDAYSAEKQALRFMQKVSKQISTPALAEGTRMHIEQTQTQIERLEQALEALNERPGRKVCEAMRGLIEEAQHTLEEQDKGPLMDLVLVAGMQRIEHYEISAYGTSAALATALGHSEVADLLSQTLEEEKLMDSELTEVTQEAIMPEALSGEDEEGEDEEGEDEDEEGEDTAEDAEVESKPKRESKSGSEKRGGGSRGKNRPASR